MEVPARKDAIKSEAEKKLTSIKVVSWQERLLSDEEDDPEDQACIICST